MVRMEIDHTQKRVWIALLSVTFHRRPDLWLAEQEIGEVLQLESVCIALEELCGQPLHSEIVNFWIGVKEVEVNVDNALLGSQSHEQFRCGWRQGPLQPSTHPVAIFASINVLFTF